MAESTQPAPVENKNNTTSTRRKSSGWMPAFEGLQQHHGSQANVTRRESMSDQQPKGGIFSQLFHNNFGRNAK
ncbi:unnamed protein product [Clonostachys rosea]|uniref:Uncharacterized protein n=1 Tax=Bionectria ochroleuca TaxID=29856 RepID=A0ABY6UUD4_BIOOC|nr:unnamed protein product [Clonostachys rosea]